MNVRDIFEVCGDRICYEPYVPPGVVYTLSDEGMALGMPETFYMEDPGKVLYEKITGNITKFTFGK